MTTEATTERHTTPTTHDRQYKRLADAFERLTITVAERPDLVELPDWEGQTIADRIEALADWLTEAAKDYPAP